MAASPVSAEYKLKAALIYKLTKFVEWPEAAGDTPNQSFGICVLGKDYFGSALNALEERKAQGKPITVLRFTQSEAIDLRCQMLFISDSKQAFVGPILDRLQKKPILTLGDMEKFAETGGILQFTTGHQRIGFRINLQSAKQAGLTIAAPLLELSTIVE